MKGCQYKITVSKYREKLPQTKHKNRAAYHEILALRRKKPLASA